MPGVPLLPLAIQFGAGIIFNTQDNEVGEKIKNGRCLPPKACSDESLASARFIWGLCTLRNVGDKP